MHPTLVLIRLVIFFSVGEGSILKTLQPRATESVLPSPVVVPPSQNWDGNDGPWSSFFLRVGTPEQDVRILISTAVNQPWVVLPQGCDSSSPSNCADMRGGKFNINASTTWVFNNKSNTSIYDLYNELYLGFDGRGEYGYDTISLGYDGANTPTLENQVVAGIATDNYFLGVFGLDPSPSNFSNFNDPIPSYMSNLKTQGHIPSISYGYTAGNQYRMNQVLGSLVIGGYDVARFIPNNLSYTFNSVDLRDLTVNLKSISMTTSTNSTPTILSTADTIPLLVDSTLPYLWLPEEVCANFEAAFGITYDISSELYLVNDTLHEALLSQNANVTFSLSNLTSSEQVDIVLPYAAFDLIAEWPLVANQTRYFPLKRAANETQYTLGRTFLQESYLIVDHERKVFSLSACNWNSTAMNQDVRTIAPPSNSTTTPNSSPNSHSSSNSHLLVPLLASIIPASVLSISFFIILYIRYRRSQRIALSPPPLTPSGSLSSPSSTKHEFIKPELDANNTLIREIEGSPVSPFSEADSKTVVGSPQTHELGILERFELMGDQPVLAEMGPRSRFSFEQPQR